MLCSRYPLCFSLIAPFLLTVINFFSHVFLTNTAHTVCHPLIRFPPPRVVDTIGAGDSFNAGVIASMAHGDDAITALKRACVLAGKKVGQVGFDGLGDKF